MRIKNNMTAVIYARYSSDSQREESIEGQLRECKEYAERNGITILATYIDRALSAKTDHRPDFQRMIKDGTKGLFDMVLVWKLDRFARNRYDSAHYKSVLRRNGIKVVSVKEPIAEDSTGILVKSLLEGMAEYYSADLSEKVIRGLTDNALKCKYNGGTVPMGYVVDKELHQLQVDPVNSHIVVEMFKRYADGETMKQLVDSLNGRGIRSAKGNKITLNIMEHLLKNRRYIGEYRYRDVITPGGIPAIVPLELFEKVQERLKKNKKAPARFKAEDKYLLTTKLICGKCGAFMTGESGTSHTMRVHHYYKCFGRRRHKCDKKNVQKEWIENLVVDQTMKILFDDALMESVADMMVELQGQENTTLPALNQQLADTKKAIKNIVAAIEKGAFTPSTKERLDELEETRSQLEVSILQEEMQRVVFTREQILDFLHHFRNTDISDQNQRQKLIDYFVNSVILYEDKIIITFNYKEGEYSLSFFDAVQGSDLSALGAPYLVKSYKSVFAGLWLFSCSDSILILSPTFRHSSNILADFLFDLKSKCE